MNKKYSSLFAILLSIVIASIISCSQSASHYNRIIDDAEKVMQINPDSAMTMLDAIDPSDLTVDSVRSKYHYVKAWGHMKQNRSMIGTSCYSDMIA